MLSHIVTDLHASYLEEVFKPQLGKPGASAPKAEKSEKGGAVKTDSGATSEKRIRQAVYDIRYRARREDIPLEQAFSQYMSHTSMNGVEKNEVKEKLGIGPGSKSVSEEYLDEAPHYNKYNSNTKKYQIRVTDKKTGKSYVRYATREKINQLRSNPNISSVEMTKYGTPYEGERDRGEYTSKAKSGVGLNPGAGEKQEKKFGPSKGKNTVGDLDRDGTKEPDRHEYAGVKDTAIKKSIASKKPVKEEFSNWREDLQEVVKNYVKDDKQRKIEEKEVDNYADKSVVINPEFTESIQNLGGQLIESVELSEEYIAESANVAAQYFCEQGLNEVGVEILIEELGLDDFVSFVFEINNEVISEARAGGVKIEPVTATGKPFKSGKPTKKGLERLQNLKAQRKEREEKASSEKPSGMKAALQRQSAVANAKKQQPKKKGVLDRVAGAVLSGIERHNAAMSAAKETGKTIRKAAGKVGDVAKEVGKGASGAAKLAGHVASKGLGEESQFDEEYKDLPTGRMVRQAAKHGQRGGMAHLKQRQVEKTPRGLRTLTGSRERSAELNDVKTSSYKKAAMMTAVADTHDPEKSKQKSSLNRARGTKSNIRQFSRTAAEEYEMNEAVYGGVDKKKEESKKLRVTNADKVANTPAYQNYKKGDERYTYVGEETLSEKAESEQQQKLFGLALSVKRGQTPRSEVSAEVLKIVDSMSEKEIRKYAKTKHSGIPKKIDEAIAKVRKGSATATETAQREVVKKQLENAKDEYGVNEDFENQMDPQEINLRRQEASIRKRIADLRQKKVRKMSSNQDEVQKEETINELRRSEEQGKGSPESRSDRSSSGYLSGPRAQNITRGQLGGRHYWSGGEGGSRSERGKKKNEPGSQHSRLNPPEKPKVRKKDLGSRFD